MSIWFQVASTVCLFTGAFLIGTNTDMNILIALAMILLILGGIFMGIWIVRDED